MNTFVFGLCFRASLREKAFAPSQGYGAAFLSRLLNYHYKFYKETTNKTRRIFKRVLISSASHALHINFELDKETEKF